MADLVFRRQQLLNRLKELDERLHEIVDELDEPTSKDWAESATEREGVEVLESLGDSGAREILAIRAALKRMDNDEYGFCVKCGDAIPEDRLNLLPATPFCRTCAR